MIDIVAEHLIPIREVPRHLPCRRTGRRVHISAVYRWIGRGVGGVQLESVKVGGSTYTTTEALQRFSDRLSHPNTDSPSAPSLTSSARRKQIDASTRHVERILGNERPRKGADR
jgi:Protein of unknown function (DUF1580)